MSRRTALVAPPPNPNKRRETNPLARPELLRVKCLFFDVFGTCVDWRSSMTDALYRAVWGSLKQRRSTIDGQIYTKASEMTYEEWGDLAQAWRNSYLSFTKSVAFDPTIPFKAIDDHHLESLRVILSEYGLVATRRVGLSEDVYETFDASLFTEDDMYYLCLEWHRLTPWKDVVNGIRQLNTRFRTFTLSNGNLSLLNDLVQNAGLPFTGVYSAQMFKTYKPNSKVYLGAAEAAGVRPDECMMVAAHLDDLKFARKNGFRTMYVERPAEERHPHLRYERDLVDIWVTLEEYGFMAGAERIGIDVIREPRPGDIHKNDEPILDEETREAMTRTRV